MEIDYYFSGIGTFKDEILDKAILKCEHRLQSCHASYYKNAVKWCTRAEELGHRFDLMLDSGAFTAWTKGDEVDLDHLMHDYGAIIERFGQNLDRISLINLDKIPGAPGRTPGYDEIQRAIEISDKNFAILQKHFGDIVLPVFHQGEDLTRLAEVKAQTNFICISPRNDLPEYQRVLWSQEVHAQTIGWQTHGLAATGLEMMSTVPWSTVDSASWVFTGALGDISILLGGNVRNISCSDESPAKKELGKHLDNITPIEKDAIITRLHEIGLTEELVRTSHGHRMFCNLHEITDWCNTHHKKPFSDAGLFDL